MRRGWRRRRHRHADRATTNTYTDLTHTTGDRNETQGEDRR
jgi:hypothetical protein